MENSFNFEHAEWIWEVIMAAVLVFAVFVWKEWNQKFERRFYLNSLIGLIGLISLTMLILKPTVLKKVRGEAVLLTPGYNKEKLDSLKKENRRLKIIEYKPGTDVSPYLDSINQLQILGHGVKSYDLWQFNSENTEFLPSEISEGIIRLKYDKSTTLGEDLIVQGLYKNPKAQTKLVLQGPGGKDLDSLTIEKGGDSDFVLQTNLKVRGKFIYNLQTRDSSGTVLKSDPLPVKVDARKLLNILILNEFPSFETKYLKNFLSEEGHKVVARSKITKQKYKFEYFNTDRKAVYGLNRENLSDLDLLVVDDQSLKNLSRQERLILEEAIIEQGLGVFVQQTGKNFQTKNALGEFKVIQDGHNTIQLSDNSNSSIEKYQIEFEHSGLLDVPIDTYGLAMRLGQGYLGSSLLKNTYQLVLDGENWVYNEVWSSLLNTISKRNTSAAFFTVTSDFNYINEPFSFSFNTSEKNPELILDHDYSIPLKKDEIIGNEWKGQIYPKSIGWHQLVSAKDSTIKTDFYILESGSWSSVNNNSILNLNKRFFANQKSSYSEKYLPIPINAFWFFGIFVLTMAFLWLEPKLR